MRAVGRVARREERRQDHHALGVDRPGQLHLALDVDDLAVAQPRGGRDAGGKGKRIVAGHAHGQSVDLPDRLAVRVDEQVPAQDRFVDLLADAIGPPHLAVQGLLDMRSRATTVPPDCRTM